MFQRKSVFSSACSENICYNNRMGSGKGKARRVQDRPVAAGSLLIDGVPTFRDEEHVKEWRVDGRLHRDDGPAVEWKNGTNEWWQNGKPHREDGAAVEYQDGRKDYWLHGTKVTEGEVEKLIGLNRLKNVKLSMPERTTF